MRAVAKITGKAKPNFAWSPPSASLVNVGDTADFTFTKNGQPEAHLGVTISDARFTASVLTSTTARVTYVGPADPALDIVATLSDNG